MTGAETVQVDAAGECLRCGYSLVGIANDQACPECGLLAERSRRVTDELHESRPRWLRRLSWGVWFILLGVASPVPLLALLSVYERELFSSAWARGVTWRVIWDVIEVAPFDVGLVLLSWGVWLLSSREGYPPVDVAEARPRRRLRQALAGPWLALIVFQLDLALDYAFTRYLGDRAFATAVVGIATLGSMPLVILVGRRLRAIAGRARSAHLAEHCVIVSVGAAATLAYAFGVMVVTNFAEQLGLGAYWTSRSYVSLGIVLAMTAAGALFVLWQLYLLVRFAFAFGAAARRLRRQWRADDRATVTAPATA